MKGMDVHVHIGKDTIYDMEQSAEDITKQMEMADIEKSVIFPFADLISIEERNRLVRNAVDHYPEKFVGMYCLNPWDRDVVNSIEKHVDKSRIVGLFLDAEVYAINFTKSFIQSLFARANEHEFPVIIHTDHPQSRAIQGIGTGLKEISTKYPGVKIIVRATVPGVMPLANQENVFLETSMMTNSRNIKVLVSAFGARKLVFGSGSPIDNAYTIRQLVEFAEITDFEKELILGKNLRKILEH